MLFQKKIFIETIILFEFFLNFINSNFINIANFLFKVVFKVFIWIFIQNIFYSIYCIWKSIGESNRIYIETDKNISLFYFYTK